MRTPKITATYRNNYRPELTRCPHCHWKLKRWSTLWRKFLSTLAGRIQVLSQCYHCANLNCPAPEAVYRSTEAETLSVPGCSYGIEVIFEVGYQRFWLQRTVQEIHGSLKERVPLSERHVLNLLADFLALVRSGQPAKVAQLHPQWQKLGSLVLST